MRIMVTGGAGYIGSHTLIDLRAAGHAVHVVDTFANASPVALDRVAELTGAPVPHDRVDIRDADALGRVFEAVRPDAVIHFAGLKAVGESAEKPLAYYDTNVGGTVALLGAMDRVGCRRIVFSSSATVYGEADYLPFDEAHPLRPTNVYGHTKLVAEQVLRAWQAATPEAGVAVLRYFNPVGAHASGRIGEDPEGPPNNLMPFVAQVAGGRRDLVRVFGDDYDTPDGTGMRDYIHITDLARAHTAALDHAARGPGWEAFNIGTGESHSVLEMIAAFSRAAGREIPHEVVARREGDIARSVADPSKAQAALGWRAEHGLDEMCRSTWAWQAANPEGYR